MRVSADKVGQPWDEHVAGEDGRHEAGIRPSMISRTCGTPLNGPVVLPVTP